LQRLGDAWVKAGNSVILAVPSAIVPNELNLLLNPRHPNFAKIDIHVATDFVLDRRLFH
jgi:RES domain-containing protein